MCLSERPNLRPSKYDPINVIWSRGVAEGPNNIDEDQIVQGGHQIG